MANTYVIYPGQTGSTRDFTIPFEYLSRDYVKVTVNGASVPFTFLTSNMIRLDTAPIGDLKIYRETDASQLVNDYSDASILIDDDLNESYYQSLHISEELSESALRQSTAGLHWNALGLPIENLGDPSKPQDAATNKQITQVNARIDQEITDRTHGDNVLHYRIDGMIGEVSAIAERAENSAIRAEAGAVESEAHALQAHALVEAATSGFTGFNDGDAYDFGWVNDPMTYFNRDWGTL